MPIAAPRLLSATITSREYRAPGFWCVGIRAPEIAQTVRPAQYVALEIPGDFSVRLPLGVFTADTDEFTLLFQRWGPRTTALTQMNVGDSISCIGPLGNEFALPKSGSRAVIVAGGLGIVPFWLLARELKAARVETTMILGARAKEYLVGASEMANFGTKIHLCTDDGSHGYRGSVVAQLADLAFQPDVVYGCGPRAMLRSLCDATNARKLWCQVSMEETFGCSMGTCWGCVVPVQRGSSQGTGYPRAPRESREYDLARVCTDGTVFNAADVVWTN